MDKMQMRAAARAFIRAAQMPGVGEPPPRTTREQAKAMIDDTPVRTRGRTPPPIDKARARQACAPMGALHSIVVTVDVRKRRRTWYIVDPDPAVATQYSAAGLDLTPEIQARRPYML